MKLIAGLLLIIAPVAAWAAWGRQDEAIGEGDFSPDLEPMQLPEPSFLEGIGLMAAKQTRGERNNNPGNIRISGNAWQGKVQGSDSAFETFASPEMGIRAMAVLLRNYQKQGLKTVRQIISRWAPANENNTAAYVAAVASAVGVGADQTIDLSNDATLERLVTAVIKHENGRVIYSAGTIAQGVANA